jgi:O-antigen ligase
MAMVLGVVAGLMACGVLTSDGSGAEQALIDRATSILKPGETLDTASLEWRIFEVGAAMKSIHDHPVLGVGLGNSYRDVTLLHGEAAGWLYDLNGPGSLTRFVHNSYTYLTVKMGLVTLVVFAWFSLSFIYGGARAYLRAATGPAKLVMLAAICSFVGLLEWAGFEAHFMLPASMATVGLMVGLVASGSQETLLDRTPAEFPGPTHASAQGYRSRALPLETQP